MKQFLGGLLLASTAWAAIEGTVVDRTTDRPVAGVEVRLVRMGDTGPETAGSVLTDSAGRFRFQPPAAAVHYLLEVRYDGVLYNRMVPPEEAARPVELTVYRATRNRDAARLTQRIVFLEPGSEGLSVTETWLWRNDGRRTWNDPQEGALRFFVPENAAQPPAVTVTAPGGMPVPRPARKAGELWQVDFPLKPGETRCDVTYSLPASGAFSTRMPYPDVPTRLVVAPGVILSGEGLQSLGQDPSLGASIFEIRGRKEFRVQIQGTGSLRAAVEEDAGPSIEPMLPRIYEGWPWVVIPTALSLALGFLLLYRTRVVARRR